MKNLILFSILFIIILSSCVSKKNYVRRTIDDASNHRGRSAVFNNGGNVKKSGKRTTTIYSGFSDYNNYSKTLEENPEEGEIGFSILENQNSDGFEKIKSILQPYDLDSLQSVVDNLCSNGLFAKRKGLGLIFTCSDTTEKDPYVHSIYDDYKGISRSFVKGEKILLPIYYHFGESHQKYPKFVFAINFYSKENGKKVLKSKLVQRENKKAGLGVPQFERKYFPKNFVVDISDLPKGVHEIVVDFVSPEDLEEKFNWPSRLTEKIEIL